jgi:anti-sigma-K factor RskA
MMDHAELQDLLALAALGRLDPVEQAALETHLRQGCAQCEAELKAFKEAAAALALSLEPESVEQRIWLKLKARLEAGAPEAALAPELKAAQAGKLQEREPSRPAALRAGRPPRLGLWRIATGMAAAAALVLAIVAGAITREFQRIDQVRRARIAELEKQAASLADELSVARTRAAHLEQALNQRAVLQNVLMASDVRMMHLKPLAPAPNARAMIAMSAASRSALIQVAGLPPTPADKAYEMWWITKQRGPVAAGVFRVEAGHEAIASIDLPPADERLLMAAVTLEAAPGVAKPAGPMYLKAAAADR